MNQAFEIARKNCSTAAKRNKGQYDKRVRGVEIEIGDRVLYGNREGKN